MSIQIIEEVENESIINFLKKQKNCIACLNEPLGGTIMRFMEQKSMEMKSLKWYSFPNANIFEVLTVNSDQEIKSIDKIQYDKLDNLLEEMCVFAMITNLIKTREILMKVPKNTFILVFNEKSPGLDIISKWRKLQEKRLLFTCRQTEWSSTFFPETGIYKWKGIF